jgi:hypothetical protein
MVRHSPEGEIAFNKNAWGKDRQRYVCCQSKQQRGFVIGQQLSS